MKTQSIDFLKECILSTAPTTEYGILGDDIKTFIPYIRMEPEHYTSPKERKLFGFFKDEVKKFEDEYGEPYGTRFTPDFLWSVVRGEFNLGRDYESELDECRDEIMFILCNLMKLQERIITMRNILCEFRDEDKNVLRDNLNQITEQLKNLQPNE